MRMNLPHPDVQFSRIDTRSVPLFLPGVILRWQQCRPSHRVDVNSTTGWPVVACLMRLTQQPDHTLRHMLPSQYRAICLQQPGIRVYLARAIAMQDKSVNQRILNFGNNSQKLFIVVTLLLCGGGVCDSLCNSVPGL